MNIRKPTDYSAMYRTLDQLMRVELPQMGLYFEIGMAVCARLEKGAAVMAAEYLQANYPECKGFSPPKPAPDAGVLPGLRRQPRTPGTGPEAGLDAECGDPGEL